jgi:hypothetical protein
LFNIVEISGNRSLRITTPTAVRARVVSNTLGAYKVSIECVVVETSKMVHSIRN